LYSADKDDIIYVHVTNKILLFKLKKANPSKGGDAKPRV